MNKFLILLSGEHPIAGIAETESLLNLLSYSVEVKWYGRVGILSSDSNPIPFLLERAALIQHAGRLLVTGTSNDTHQLDVTSVVLSASLKPSSTFAIRTQSLGHKTDVDFREAMIRKLGTDIISATGTKVSLDNPDTTLLLVFSEEQIFLCSSFESKARKQLRDRHPTKRAFFHPSMMNAILARIMCNLAGVLPEEIVLDPFCGSGGILYEIISLGAQAIGFDLNWNLLQGSQMNLTNADYNLIQTDARTLPIDMNRCDVIVTDPPYGRTSSTKGVGATALVEDMLWLASDKMQKGGRLCICASSEMNLVDTVHRVGFQGIRKIELPVHKTLVRHVISAHL